MGGIYPGGGYPGQYSAGGSAPPDVAATPLYFVTIRAEAAIVTVRPDPEGVRP